MISKTSVNASMILSMLFVFTLYAEGRGGNALATGNALLQATATEVEQLDRSSWVWRNHFANNSGAASTRLLANDDPDGGKTCYIADDFQVGQDSIWVVDTLRTWLFWNRRAPDYIQVLIWPDLYGLPAEDTILYNFSFTVNMPNQLTLYDIKAGVRSQNIVLPAGVYWISFIGVYETGTWAADTFVTYWNIMDTIVALEQCQCMDSIGAAYTQYPTPWLGIWFQGGNQYNSVKFWIKADVQTNISNNGFHKPEALIAVYPNPSSDHIVFTFTTTGAQRIEIYDVTGRRVKTVGVFSGNRTVNVQALTNGTYFYQALDKAGGIIDRGKFLVSK